MKDLDYTVEDYLETLVGLRTDEKFEIDRSDQNFVRSIGRQVFKGVSLTDRQCDAVKEKLIKYEDQFISNGYASLKNNLDRLRFPVREIDRSRWIKIVDDAENIILSSEEKGPWIAVRFSFQKKLISAIEEIRRKLEDSPKYNAITKVQYFEYNERNLYEIVTAFKDKNFVLDEQVLTLYQSISKFTKEDSVPGIFNYKIKNLHPNGVKMLVDEIGEPTQNNLLLYKDRSYKYGLHCVENLECNNSLESKIAHRSTPAVQVNKSRYSVDDLVLALENLKRFPILVIVPSTTCYDAVVSTHEYVKNLIDPAEVSVTFRMDNHDEGIDFNKYIKREKINNKVDKHTKIVYNLDNKVPKPVVNSGWTPNTILIVGTTGLTSTRKVLDLYPGVDLMLYHIDGESPGYSRYMRREMDLI
jgi:hypothetical protein